MRHQADGQLKSSRTKAFPLQIEAGTTGNTARRPKLFATEAANSPRGESPWRPCCFHQCHELVIVNDLVAMKKGQRQVKQLAELFPDQQSYKVQGHRFLADSQPFAVSKSLRHRVRKCTAELYAMVYQMKIIKTTSRHVKLERRSCRNVRSVRFAIAAGRQVELGPHGETHHLPAIASSRRRSNSHIKMQASRLPLTKHRCP